MIITLDGPVASGKSTLAEALARRLSYYYLNSGLLYRAAAWLLYEHGLSIDDIKHVFHAHEIVYEYGAMGARVFFKGQDITDQLKNALNDARASKLSIDPEIRALVNEYQRNLAQKYSLVIDGRDCGTVVFPHADYKFFVTAPLSVRAARWREDQERKYGLVVTQEDAEKSVVERDDRDTNRPVAPLKKAPDAHEIDTAGKTIEQVVQELVSIIQ